ncbi:MAG TPA: type II toxin-antitoxin system RelE/ParE family toxin [Sulfurovum sp.]|nr:type II toxin-antitoxin system RelE/ParE family toxin [Sulfurovum sp.]
MVSFDIKWKASAKKELRKISQSEIPKIINTIEKLSIDQHPQYSKKIIGTKHIFRIRIGSYRVIYSIQNEKLIIEIIKAGHRKEIYK